MRSTHTDLYHTCVNFSLFTITLSKQKRLESVGLKLETSPPAAVQLLRPLEEATKTLEYWGKKKTPNQPKCSNNLSQQHKLQLKTSYEVHATKSNGGGKDHSTWIAGIRHNERGEKNRHEMSAQSSSLSRLLVQSISNPKRLRRLSLWRKQQFSRLPCNTTSRKPSISPSRVRLRFCPDGRLSAENKVPAERKTIAKVGLKKDAQIPAPTAALL